MFTFVKGYLPSLAIAALLLTPRVFAYEARPAERIGMAPRASSSPRINTGLSEDGSPYAEESSYAFDSPARADWLLGKIEPAVEEAADSQGMINVIVYLHHLTSLPETQPTVDQIKTQYYLIIDDLSHQIREILDAGQPGFPLPEELERLWVTMGPSLTETEQTRLDSLRFQLDAHLDAMRREIGVVIKQRADLSFAPIREFILDGGGIINKEVSLVTALGVTVPSELLTRLGERDDVQTIMLDRPLELELDVSMPSLGVDTWWSGGFDGGVFDAGVVDTGVQENHPAFAAVTFYTDAGSPTDGDGHGTHVAGIIASGNATYAGAANALDALIWGVAGDQAGTMSRMETLASGLAQSPEVINHSLGYGTANVSDYNSNDTFYDAFVESYDIMVAKSAGNMGWGASTPTITHPAPAYNLLAVANMNDQGTTDRGDDVRRTDSSVGPTVNGRLKPDITAPGTTIRSTNAFWVGSGSGGNRSCRDPSVLWDWVDCSGTSMAAPHVAGMIVVMEDAGNNTPIAQKAVLLNTADAWDSNGTATTADDGPVGGSAWDKSYGWGYLDSWEAHFNRADYFVTTVIPKNDNATEDDYKLYKGQMFDGEKATLVWEKRGVYVAGGPSATTYSLTDLNLRLYDEVTGSEVDSDLNGIDNVHQVAAASAITAVIKPYAWSSSFDGAASETFALATEENFTAVDFPDSFQGYVSSTGSVQPNEEFTYDAWVGNNSVLASHANSIEVQLPAGWSIVSGANPQNIGSIAGGGAHALTHAVWTLRAQATPALDVAVNFSHSHSSYLEDYGPQDWALNIDVVEDVTAPTPNPMTWSSMPSGVSTSQIGMTATTATDANGPVEYYFDFTSSPMGGTGGSDSGWITSTSYTDDGLLTNHSYCYRVQARDNAIPTPNQTGYTSTACRFSQADTPGSGSVSSVASDTLRAAWNANGNPAWTGYYVENQTNGNNSGWISNTSWDNAGLPEGTYSYRVKARSANGIETWWRSLGTATLGVFADGFESGSVSTLLDGQGYDFSAQTSGGLSHGDFYFLYQGGVTRFWANNAGMRGLVDLGVTSGFLGDITVPASGYDQFGVQAFTGHTYVSLAAVGEEDYYIIFRVQELSTAATTLEWVYVYRP